MLSLKVRLFYFIDILLQPGVDFFLVGYGRFNLWLFCDLKIMMVRAGSLSVCVKFDHSWLEMINWIAQSSQDLGTI